MKVTTFSAGSITALLMLLTWAGEANAATATFWPSKDNTLFESATGDASLGVGDGLFAGRTNQTTDLLRRAVLAFNVTGHIPPGSVIHSASLALTVPDLVLPRPDAVFTVRPLLSDWGQGFSDIRGDESDGAPSADGDATWIHTFFPDQFWVVPGGDFGHFASASVLVGGGGTYTWDGLACDVQGWVDSPESNFGWILIGDESTLASVRRFASAEYPFASKRPVLTVDYTPPAEAPLMLDVSVNGPAFVSGDTVELSLSAANPGLPNIVDVYAVILFPDGNAMVNFISLDGSFEIGSLSDIGPLSPMVASLSLASAFNVSLSPFFTYSWSGAELAGDYSAFLLMAHAGSLSDGSIDAGDLIELTAVSFTFNP
jgi:hypothetical protein